jgi:hypothetical protein
VKGLKTSTLVVTAGAAVLFGEMGAGAVPAPNLANGAADSAVVKVELSTNSKLKLQKSQIQSNKSLWVRRNGQLVKLNKNRNLKSIPM